MDERRSGWGRWMAVGVLLIASACGGGESAASRDGAGQSGSGGSASVNPGGTAGGSAGGAGGLQDGGVGGAGGLGAGGTGGEIPALPCGSVLLHLHQADGMPATDFQGIVRTATGDRSIVCLNEPIDPDPMFGRVGFDCGDGWLEIFDLPVEESLEAHLWSRDGSFEWSGAVQLERESIEPDCDRQVGRIQSATQIADPPRALLRLSVAEGYTSDVYALQTNTRMFGWVEIVDEDGGWWGVQRDMYQADCAECGVMHDIGELWPIAERVQPGTFKQVLWDREWPTLACWHGFACDAERVLRPGAYIARFCWGPSAQAAEAPWTGGDVAEQQCAEVPFDLPASGQVVVEYVIGAASGR